VYCSVDITVAMAPRHKVPLVVDYSGSMLTTFKALHSQTCRRPRLKTSVVHFLQKRDLLRISFLKKVNYVSVLIRERINVSKIGSKLPVDRGKKTW
jgi:hypothetical protein